MPENTAPENQDPGDGATATLPPEPPHERPRPKIHELTRSTDDSMVAGVSTGIARHFDIDPIIVRVAFVALTVVGLAGLILYLGLWFLLPYADGRKSVAAGWFGLDEREPEFRTVGLVLTGVLAAASVFGDTGWFWGGPVWAILIFLTLFWLVVVLPRRGRAVAEGTSADGLLEDTPGPVAAKRPRQAPVLFGLTACVAAVVLGGLWLYGELGDVEIGHRTYLATALVVVGLGAVVGAFWGRSAGLIAVGIILVPILSLSGALPSGTVGDQRHRPGLGSELDASYSHGIGRFELDLGALGDPQDVAALTGRTVRVDTGIGETVVMVPEGLPVTVQAELDAGEIDIFGDSVEIRGPEDDVAGPDVVVSSEDPEALVLDIDQTFGYIKVVRS